MSESLNHLVADLSAAPREADAKVSIAVRKSAFLIEGTSKMFVPVDTGNLKNSISSSPIGEMRQLQPGDMDAEIGPTADYGAYVEEGTSVHAPQAYMGPALDRHSADFEAAINQAISEVL